jgi:hypothetical protein
MRLARMKGKAHPLSSSSPIVSGTEGQEILGEAALGEAAHFVVMENHAAVSADGLSADGDGSKSETSCVHSFQNGCKILSRVLETGANVGVNSILRVR